MAATLEGSPILLPRMPADLRLLTLAFLKPAEAARLGRASRDAQKVAAYALGRLEKLLVVMVDGGSTEGTLLGTALKHCRRLRSLFVQGNSPIAASLILQNAESLRDVCIFGEDAAEAVLEAASRCRALQAYSTEVSLTKERLRRIAQGCPRLQALHTNGNLDWSELLRVKLPRLQRITASSSTLPSGRLRAIVKHYPNLTDLEAVLEPRASPVADLECLARLKRLKSLWVEFRGTLVPPPPPVTSPLSPRQPQQQQEFPKLCRMTIRVVHHGYPLRALLPSGFAAPSVKSLSLMGVSVCTEELIRWFPAADQLGLTMCRTTAAAITSASASASAPSPVADLCVDFPFEASLQWVRTWWAAAHGLTRLSITVPPVLHPHVLRELLAELPRLRTLHLANATHVHMMGLEPSGKTPGPSTVVHTGLEELRIMTVGPLAQEVATTFTSSLSQLAGVSLPRLRRLCLVRVNDHLDVARHLFPEAHASFEDLCLADCPNLYAIGSGGRGGRVSFPRVRWALVFGCPLLTPLAAAAAAAATGRRLFPPTATTHLSTTLSSNVAHEYCERTSGLFSQHSLHPLML